MIAKRFTKSRLVKAVFGCLFGIIGIFGGMMAPVEPVYAVPAEEVVDENVTETNDDSAESTKKVAESVSCDDTLGSLAWLACPGTGAISKATDFLYEKIESILVINPVEMKDGEPVYEIWKYAKGVANIVFIGFLLVVVYSQITGMGINNYGIKKILPKLIVAAVLVNLSFIICSLAVDVSNIIGGGVRGLFTSIGEATVGTSGVSESVRLSEIYASIGGGTLLTVGVASIVWGPGAIWMLMATVLGAIVAVVIGLVTIAMRQAVVMLLIMISPLAVVAYMLPNTEKWFKMWKELLMRMLVFYPLFSLLFGASALAGWAIIASAKEDGFMVILGVAVQTFPLFFSWSLMKMSGTVLGTINSKLTALASKPLAQNRAWAESRRDAARAKALASGRVYTPSLALRQYMSERKIARDEETNEHNNTIKNRGLAYAAKKNYKKDGTPSREGLRAYEEQARNMRYTATINRHKNNMNGGYTRLDAVKQISAKENPTVKEKALLDKLTVLDWENIDAADDLKFELSRGAQIEYENAQGFQQRVTDAMNAHADNEAIKAGNKKYELHYGVLNGENGQRNLARYDSMNRIMDGNEIGVYFAAADAAHSFSAQSQVVRGKFKDFFNYTVPTQDVENRLKSLTTTDKKTTNSYIDPIISGLQILNTRGDTDILRRQLNNVFADRKIDLGTYASQALAGFMMFDVKDNDPFLRRFGKYINIETAQMFNENDPEKRRTRRDVSMYEYVNGEYVDCDEDGNVIKENGVPKMRKSKMDMGILLAGTPFKGMERTAIKDMIEGIRENSVDIDEDGKKTNNFNYDKFKKNEEKLWKSIMPNIVGDQFSFLSGSEQINALGKGITGVDKKKHGFDWDGIFGKDVAKQLTPEQKKDYIEFLHQRTKKFLNGHVPAQIARSKSDMLESIMNQYALVDAAKDPELWEKIQKNDYEMDGKSYEQLEGEHIGEVRKEFVGSFTEDAVKVFLKQHKRGYQGEAKDKLIKLFNPEELYAKYFPDESRQNHSVEDDEEEGMLVSNDVESDTTTSGPLYSDARNEMEAIFNSYRGSMGNDVAGFWEQIRSVVESESVKRGNNTIAGDFDAALSQYTSVSALYVDIINRLFGGF